MKQHTHRLAMFFGLTVMPFLCTSCTSVQTLSTCASGQPNLLINGSFEATSNPNYESAYALIEAVGRNNKGVKFVDKHPDTDFPGWFTTGGIALQQGGFSKGQKIELGQSGFLGVPSADGTVFAEMDGNHHNQILSVIPGKTVEWEFSHRGRLGTDTVSMSIGAPNSLELQSLVASSNKGWSTHTGTYVVPNDVSQLQITITPVEASDGDIDSSHLLDNVKLCYTK